MAGIIDIPMEEVRDNSFRLARTLVKENIFPTIIYAVTRGGVYVANPISEYYNYIGKEPRYGVVNAYSYKGIGQQSKVVIEGWVPSLEDITEKDRVLIVEDVIDSRKSIEAILADIEEKTPLKRDVKLPPSERRILIAVHDFKLRYDIEDMPKTRPDFFAKKWVIGSEEEKVWLNYLSHELVGLTEKQVMERYGI